MQSSLSGESHDEDPIEFRCPVCDEDVSIIYSWFHIKGTLSVHSFNGDYLSVHTGSWGYLLHEIPSI